LAEIMLVHRSLKQRCGFYWYTMYNSSRETRSVAVDRSRLRQLMQHRTTCSNSLT